MKRLGYLIAFLAGVFAICGLADQSLVKILMSSALMILALFMHLFKDL